MSHLVRAGLLLALFKMGFLFMRSMSTSISTGFIGLTGGDIAREWATRPVLNQSSPTCAECHQATNSSWEASPHTSVSCENCHGSAMEHIEKARNEEEAPLAIADGRDLCLTYHAELPSRPTDFPQVNPNDHGVLVKNVRMSCASHHNPHSPGIPPEITHPLEGRSQCLVYRGPDEWKPVRSSHADVTDADRLKCHSPQKEI